MVILQLKSHEHTYPYMAGSSDAHAIVVAFETSIGIKLIPSKLFGFSFNRFFVFLLFYACVIIMCVELKILIDSVGDWIIMFNQIHGKENQALSKFRVQGISWSFRQ